jgi:hypothetical protein
MKSFKYSGEIQQSFITNYVPVDPCNFALVSILTAKEAVEEGQISKMIIFEYPFAIEEVQNIQEGVKIIKGKAVPKFKSTVIKSPYRVHVTNPDDVQRLEQWLETTVMNIQVTDPIPPESL